MDGSTHEEIEDQTLVEIRLHIERFYLRGRRKGLLNWILRTEDARLRDQKVWEALCYFSQVDDVASMKKVVRLAKDNVLRTTAFVCVAEKTRGNADITAARHELLQASKTSQHLDDLKEIGYLFSRLAKMTRDVRDSTRALGIAQLLIHHEQRKIAFYLLCEVTQLRSDAVPYLLAMQLVCQMSGPADRAPCIERLLTCLARNPPLQDAALVIAQIIMNPEPPIRAEVAVQLTDAKSAGLYCYLLQPQLQALWHNPLARSF